MLIFLKYFHYCVYKKNVYLYRVQSTNNLNLMIALPKVLALIPLPLLTSKYIHRL